VSFEGETPKESFPVVYSVGPPPLGIDERRYAALLEMTDFVSLRRDPTELFPELAPRLRSIVSFDCLSIALCDPAEQVANVYFWEGANWPRVRVRIPMEESTIASVWQNQTVVSIHDLSTEKAIGLRRSWLREQGMRSYCVFPLSTFHEKLGALGFGSKQAYAFSTDDIQFLHRVTDAAALCLDGTLTESLVAEERARMRLLLEISAPHIRRSEPRRSMELILESTQKWAGCDYVGIYLYDRSSDSLRLHTADAVLTEKMAPGGYVSLDGSLAGQAFRTRQSVVLDHSDLSQLCLASVQRGTELGVRVLYLTPFLSPQGPVGVLKVARREDRPFSPRDIELLEQVAATIAPAIERVCDAENSQTGNGEAPVSSVLNISPNAEMTSADDITPENFAALAGEILRQTDKIAQVGDSKALATAELLEAYVRTSKTGVCFFDDHFSYIAINDSLAEINRLPAADHLGKSVREVLGDAAELIEPLFERVLITGEPILNLEISCTLPRRSEPGHWVVNYLPIKNASGKVNRIGAVVLETTETKKLKDVSENLAREKKRQQAILDVSQALASTPDLKAAFPLISASLRRIFQQEYAALALRDEKTGRLVRFRMDFPLARDLQVGEDISVATASGGRALQERSPLIFSRDDMEGSDPEVASRLMAEGLKSLCCVPLAHPNNPLGVLVLSSTRANAFKSDDLPLLKQVAAQLATAIEIKQLKRQLGRETNVVHGEVKTSPQFAEIIGVSPPLVQVLEQARVVATSDATVLILGETGTGKGLIAQAIHRASRRSERNFITLNCAAIPTGLLESELFGHEKGAFTGAVSQKIGRLELADHGTLFLDEIGEIPMELQPKLLRVLQDHEFERLGGTRTIRVDLRLIAATNRNLGQSVAHKEFRSDLFYRLNVFPILVPPLRDRPEDIPLLVRYFVQKCASRMNRTIERVSNAIMDSLVRWRWPGNVRELENFIERSVILTDGTALCAPLNELESEHPGGEERSLKSMEREHVIRALRGSQGVLSGPMGAARRLGMSRSTLQSKIQRLGITREDYMLDQNGKTN
jgi:formate hydrogenlyase transcriptional activator